MALSNARQPLIALQPMLDALRIEQVVTLDQCFAMMRELRDATGSTVPPFEISGNQWAALMNLAIARHGAIEAEVRAQDAALIRQLVDALGVATTPLAKDRQEVLRAITAARARLEGKP